MTQPPIQWRVQVDTGRDNTFSQPIDDISAYIVSQISTSVGMADSYENVSQPATLTFTVSNRGGEFNREGYLSGELVTNGGFDSWTGNVPDGWATTETPVFSFVRQVGAGGTLFKSDPNSSTGAVCIYWSTAGSAPTLIQSNVFTPGNTYRISVPITATNEIDTQHLIPVGLYVLTNGDVSLSPIITTANDHVIYKYIQPGQTQLKLMPAGVAGSGYGAECTLDNISVKKVPLYAMVRAGMICRLQATRNGTTVTQFIGRITKIVPTVGENKDPQMSITVQDVMLDLLDAEYQAPLLTDSPTADEAIGQIFDDPSVIAWPYEKNFWMLGVPGSSELGVTTYLYSNTLTDSTTLETGQTTFSYLGDRAKGLENRQDGTSVQGYIRDLVNAEFGRFFYNPRDGMFHLHNRSHDTLNDASQVTQTFIEDDLDDVNDTYAEDLVNQVTINYTERTIGSSTEVIWQATNTPFLLKGYTSKKINARYVDATDNTIKISAKDYISPVSGTDIVANTASDGSGTDKSSAVTVGVEFGASSATLIISNSGQQDIYITTLRLRGTKMTAKDQSTDYTDWDSVHDNGLRPAPPQDVRLLDDPDLAQTAAQYQVARFRTPMQRLQSIRFNSLRNANTQNAVMDREIGDRITVQIASANHNADYYIVGMNFNVMIGGDHPAQVTYILKPASRQDFWLLGTVGRSELGQTTFLGF